MIIKVKSKEECLEAGFKQAIDLYDLDMAKQIKNNAKDDLLHYLPDDVFNTEQIVKHIENDMYGKCYHVSSGWAVPDIFVKEVVGE